MTNSSCLVRPGPFKSCPVSFYPSTSYFTQYLYEWEHFDILCSMDQWENDIFYSKDSIYYHDHQQYYDVMTSICMIGPELPFLQGPIPPPHIPYDSIEDLMNI